MNQPEQANPKPTLGQRLGDLLLWLIVIAGISWLSWRFCGGYVPWEWQ